MRFYVAADLNEILELEGLAEEALNDSRYRRSEFSSNKFCKLAQVAATDTARHGVLIAASEGRPKGFLYCTIGEHLVGTGVLMTTVIVLFVCRDVRSTLAGGRVANQLLNGARSWSSSRGGQELMVHLTGGGREIQNDRFLRRRNFNMIGGSYVI